MMYEVNSLNFSYNVTLLFHSCDHASILLSKSKSTRGKRSIETRIQWFKVLFVIWLVSLVLILFIVENALSQSQLTPAVLKKFEKVYKNLGKLLKFLYHSLPIEQEHLSCS